MSYLIAAPQAVVTAASNISGIGSTLNLANATAAAPTTGVLAPAADQVSAQIATLFSAHGQGYQRLSAQAAAFHEQFVQALAAGGNQYAATEAGAARTLTNAVNTVNASADKVLGHPLISGGAAAKAGGGGGLIGSISSGLFGGGAAAPSLGAASALALRPTGGATALSALSPLLRASGITNGAAVPATFQGVATAIENLYNFIEPYV
jgi:hypothetical protein